MKSSTIVQAKSYMSCILVCFLQGCNKKHPDTQNAPSSDKGIVTNNKKTASEDNSKHKPEDESKHEPEDESKHEPEEAYDEIQLKGEILPDTTPLVFQWYPKKYNQLILNEHKHKDRLITWSNREPKRDIYLVVHGAGLSLEKMQELKNMFLGHSRIHIVDFDTLNLTKDFELTILEKKYKISELLKYRYQEKLTQKKVPDDQQKAYLKFHQYISMGCWIDLMRIAMLYSIDKITQRGSQALYMDFDFHTGNNGSDIGTIRLPRGIALADGAENKDATGQFIENGAIAIGNASSAILDKMISEIEQILSWCIGRDDLKSVSKGAIYGAMVDVIKKTIDDTCAKTSNDREQEQKYYIIQKNGGNIRLQQDDNSWQ